VIRVIQPIKQNNEAQNLLLIMVHAGGLGDGGIEAKRRNSWCGVACGDIARDMFQMRRLLLTQKSSTGEWLCNKGKHKRTEANREACFEQRERVTAGRGR
jgi:hypothetical protein